MKDIPVLYLNKDECCGCGSCYSVCGIKAISMISDNEGFLYPIIDESKCIRCYSCIKACPNSDLKSK